MKLRLLAPWTWKMAWRETRSSRARLLLFSSSIIFGTAALVAISSFAGNMEEAINDQAKSLLGADLVISGRQPFDQESEVLIRSLGGEQTREVRFPSMVYFPGSQGTRLAEIRAIEGDFPYYGRLESDPAEAAASFRKGPYALVDHAMMLQFEARPGDPLRVGNFTFEIAGSLKAIPGGEPAASLIAPRVYIPAAYLEETELIQHGSRTSYRTYFKLQPGTDVEKLVEAMEPDLQRLRLRTDTVEERKEDLGRSLDNLYAYLRLVAFAALILGAIGVASAVHVHVRQKLNSAAILRCLGVRSRQVSAIYAIQAAGMGLFGATLGALVGIGTLDLIPAVLSDFIPFSVSGRLSWGALFQGLGLSLGMALLFALLPLSRIRTVSPLAALRMSYADEGSSDRLRWLIGGLIVLAIFVFALLQTSRWTQGLIFSGAILLVFLLLAAAAKTISTLVRRLFPDAWSYIWRQGLANLYRPNNQTVVMMVAVGLGTFLIVTMFLTRSALLHEIELATGEDKPNMVLFDIQTDQKEEILQQLSSFHLPVLQNVPIVTMRLGSLNGRPVQDIASDPDSPVREWALFREYRSTYRDHLVDSEQLLEGRFQGRVMDGSGEIPVSLYRRIAEDLHVSLGDKLGFDVQGVPVETVVGSIRDVEWRRIQPNFFVVFPAGVLEEAPQFHVLVTRTESPQVAADVQRAVVRRFPNVSIIDLELVLGTVDRVLDAISFVIRFMALFSILTGLIVVVGAVTCSRYQRLRESVLLRTLGASKAQVSRIMAVEYFLLGVFAALTGLALAIAASWALAVFLFEADFVLDPAPILVALLVVTSVTLLIGFLTSRRLCDHPPLEVLRAAAEG